MLSNIIVVVMRVKLDITKSLEENATILFETGKKAKKKAVGAKNAASRIASTEIKKKDTTKSNIRTERKIHWYMNYRWFYTKEGNLAIGGRDTDSNEEIIKKRLEPFDLVFHAEIPGSPFFVLKGAKENVFSDSEKQAVADATATYSRAWKYGVAFVDVFSVQPNQVSKKARAGEYVSKGSFMIKGKKDFYQGILKLYAVIKEVDSDYYIMFTPEEYDDFFMTIHSGSEKTSDAAKKIIKYCSDKGYNFSADEIIAGLPPGNVSVSFNDSKVNNK